MKRLIAAIVVALTATTGTAHAADISCSPVTPAKGVVLLAHWGAWTTGTPSFEQGGCDAFAADGWYAVSLDYPLNNYPAAVTYVRNKVKAASYYFAKVYIVGRSAGGSLALDSAIFADGLDGAVADAPVTNYLLYGDAASWAAIGVPTDTLRRNYSPLTWASFSKVPTRVMASPIEGLYLHSVFWANTAPQASFEALCCDHLFDPTFYPRAVAWVDAQP